MGKGWDGQRLFHCGIPVPFPSRPIPYGILVPFVPMQALANFEKGLGH